MSASEVMLIGALVAALLNAWRVAFPMRRDTAALRKEDIAQEGLDYLRASDTSYKYYNHHLRDHARN